MQPAIYWASDVPHGRLGMMARPRAGEWLEDEVRGWAKAGVTDVVSLLEPTEVLELGLEAEPSLCAAQGISLLTFPIPDRGTPRSAREFLALARVLSERVNAGGVVAIHCRAGIGRSGLMAAAILAELGVPPAAAFDNLSRARRVAVPDTREQSDWLEEQYRGIRAAR